tara:strand:- start:250 stop:633 length:384 start_codon:yes stop_codon:yes gene_type:complete
MNKHVLSYRNFVNENDSSNKRELLNKLTQVISSQINSDKGAIEATTIIKEFLRDNMGNMSELMNQPAFVKSFYECLIPWYSKYKDELDSMEIDHFVGTRNRQDPIETDIPTDNRDEDMDMDDWEFEL